MATNKEQLIAALDDVSVSDGSLEFVLTDNGLTGSDTYSDANREALGKCVVAALYRLISKPSISEGGYSIKYDPEAIRKRIAYEIGTYGLDTTVNTPTIKSRPAW